MRGNGAVGSGGVASDMSTPTPTKWAEVDVTALRDNTAAVRGFVGGRCLLMAMVKANGYGHDDVLAARAALAGGADWLGVSSVIEGLRLRQVGIGTPILNVGWTPPQDVALAAQNDIDVTVFTVDGVAAARHAARRLGRPVRVQWKLDSGMGRLGTPLPEAATVGAALRAGSGLMVTGIFTHFASADEPSLAATHDQHRRFTAWLDQCGDIFPDALVHCANSAALLRVRDTHHDMTRPGIALYGYPPQHCDGIVRLRPALTVRTLVTQVKRVAAGDAVGYGQVWRAARDSMVATLAAGYADGLDRRGGDAGHVVIDGVMCPIIGRVSMDQASVDVTELSGVTTGTVATLFGAGPVDAAAVAEQIGTIPYEVLCSVSARVPRVTVAHEGVAGAP